MTIQEFEELNGIEKMRVIARALGNCNESFLASFTIPQLIKLYKAWITSGWGFYPDQWTDRQVKQALRGHAPMWNNNGQPVYMTYIKVRKFEREDFLGMPVIKST